MKAVEYIALILDFYCKLDEKRTLTDNESYIFELASKAMDKLERINQ